MSPLLWYMPFMIVKVAGVLGGLSGHRSATPGLPRRFPRLSRGWSALRSSSAGSRVPAHPMQPHGAAAVVQGILPAAESSPLFQCIPLGFPFLFGAC
jgi:hypothetical protein